MPDLSWTFPIAHWSAVTAATPGINIGFIEPMARRRLSTLSRMALKVAHDCVAMRNGVRVVFASRHGELARTTEILFAINTSEAVSPTAFSLAVLNAMTGIFGIARADRAPATAVSAGHETLGYALLEAYSQFATDPSSPVLLVYADEPVNEVYGLAEDQAAGNALAILLDATVAGQQLSCRVCRHDSSTNTAAPDPARFASQSEAVLHCLDTRRPTAWAHAGSTWQWSWREGTA